MENNLISMEKQFQLLEQGILDMPHSILGLHPYHEEGKQVIRAFCPTASKVTLIDLTDEKQYNLYFKGYQGLFEGIIEDKKEKFLYKLVYENESGHSWSSIDPYQFDSTLTEEDLYLFGIGKDYEIYHKLGANFINVNGVEGVRFALWAPHATRVSVIGDFNNWDGRRHPMRYIANQGVWEIFIPGVAQGDLYKFEVRTQKGELLYKTDPYANYFEVRPNNAAVIYDMRNYKWKDTKWMKARHKKAHHKEAVSIYEVHIGSWKKHEDGTSYTYREAAHELAQYVKEMGYTHVELMGIIEHPFDGSWGYQVTGYFAPTSRYGTPDDFRYFIETMHKNNIGVLLDWVPAHFPKDAFALEKFDGQALYEKDNEMEAAHPHWGTLIFDYGKPQVALFLMASALSWMERYHIDGLRVDAVASMLYLDYGRDGNFIPNAYGGKENLEAIAFMKHLNEVAYERIPGIMMIAEESTAWPKVSHSIEDGGLGFGFKWNMGWMNDFINYMKTPSAYRGQEHGKITFSLMYAFSENFIQVLSHDEVVHGKASMIYKMPGDHEEKFKHLKAAYGYLYTHPGKKMLFMGDEFAQTKEWNEEVALEWELLDKPEHKGILEWVKALNKLYTTEKALWEVGNGYENFEWIDCENREQSIISFVRKNVETDEELVVVINFKPESYTDYRIGVPKLVSYEEILNSDAILYNGEDRLNGIVKATDIPWHGKPYSVEITIPPLSMIVFKGKQKASKAKKVEAKKKETKIESSNSKTKSAPAKAKEIKEKVLVGTKVEEGAELKKAKSKVKVENKNLNKVNDEATKIAAKTKKVEAQTEEKVKKETKTSIKEKTEKEIKTTKKARVKDKAPEVGADKVQVEKGKSRKVKK